MIGVVSYLQNLGFYDVILPWLLAFALVYYLSGFVFKGDNVKAVPVIIGIIAAFYLVAYTPYPTTLNTLFSNLFGEYSIAAAVIIMAIVFLALLLKPEENKTVLDKLLGLLGNDNKNLQQFLKLGFNFLLIGLAVFLLIRAADIKLPSIRLGTFHISSTMLSVIIFLIIIVAALVVVTHKGKSSGGGNKQT